VKDFIRDNIKMYLDEYKIWALRWDSPRNITEYQANPPAEVGDPDTFIPEAYSMMLGIREEIASTSRPNSSRYYSIAEDANSPGGYHAHWEISYHDAIFSRLLGTNAPLPPPFDQKYTNGPANMDTIRYRVENKEDPGFRVTFLENHDKCGDHNSSTDGKRLAYDFDTNDPTSLTAKRKTLVAAAATLASAGTPMLWMGQEQLADGDFNDKKALDWGRAQQFPGIVRFHRDLIYLRAAMPALKTASTNINQSPFVSVVTNNQTNGLLAFRRSDGTNSNNDVLVAINFSPSNNTILTDARAGGFTNVILNSHTIGYDTGLTNTGPLPGTVLAANSNATIGPWSVLLFAKTNLPLPATDANGNGLDDGIDLLTGSRAALPGTFNNWDIGAAVMKWDTNRKVYWHVSRFSAPGTNTFKAYTTNWATGPDQTFVNSSAPTTWEITFNPSNNVYGLTNHGTNANAISAAWKNFYFDSTNIADGTDPDGDGWTNLQEYQRGSDPTVAEEPRLGLVGDQNGWDWSSLTNTSANSASQMRYYGQGMWKFFRWVPNGAGTEFKIGLGPTNQEPDWGAGIDPASGNAVFKNWNFTWLTNREAWQVLTLNERNLAYTLETLPVGSLDTDGDGMPDDWERFQGLDPFAQDGGFDKDGDTIANLAEYVRGSLASTTDHFSDMWLPGDGDWTFGNTRKMVWNSSTNQWEFILYSAPRSFEVKFSADSGYSTSWGWPTTGSSNGISVRNPGINITVAVSSNGYHRIRFDEISGRYEVGSMASTDSDRDGMPDDWERFYGLNLSGSGDANGDADGDTVLNKFEYARGSHPRLADHNSQMAIPGNLPLFSGDTSATWEPTNFRRAMRWNTNNARWEAMLFASSATNFGFKFAAGAWDNGTWGWNSNSVAGQSSKWPNGPNFGNISYSLPSRGYFVVRFEEYQGGYEVTPLNPIDSNQNELPDEWEYFSGVTDPLGNLDSDSWVNRSEYYRGTDPLTNDVGVPAKRMSVTGDTSPLPSWNPAADNMVWSDQRLRWEWSGTFPTTKTIIYRFAAGDWGVWQNMTQSVSANIKYLFFIDDTTGSNAAIPYPASLDWLVSNNLANLPQNPWPVDTDKDGNNNLMEFALGGNPNVAQTNRLINSWITNQTGTNRLVLRWNERTNAATVQPQWQTDLVSSSWTNLTPSNIGGVSGGMQQKEASVPIDSTNRKFLRLRVTGP
jgi:1,4-alpha-glucan branching enzyme